MNETMEQPIAVDNAAIDPVKIDTSEDDAAPDPTKNSDDSTEPTKAGESTMELKRGLRNRHLQMIAIGGTIGTGLWIASGGALSRAGPVGALIAYAVVGTLVYSVVVSLGEMTTYIPIPGAFNVYASRFVDPSLGFAMGWIYWFSWAMTYPIELTATGFIIQYWNPDLSIGISIAIFWVGITAFNFFPVHFYGEIEFWLSMMKVLTCIGFVLFSICIIFGAGEQGFIGLKTWTTPGAFATYLVDRRPLGTFLGFWSVLIQAGFSYAGTELVGVAAGETADPRKSIPAAVKKTFFRIFFIYILTVFCIGAQIPYDNPDLLNGGSTAASSPLVIAANLAGVSGLAGVINGVLLLTMVSAGNSNVYSGSRILVGLAMDGAAPAFFLKTNKHGVPYYAVATTATFGLLGFLNLGSAGATNVFNWLINIVAVAGFISWACINASHLGFIRALSAQGLSRDKLPYKARWQPYLAWYGLIFNVVIIFTQGFTAFIPWDRKSFFAAYVSIGIFVTIYVGHKLTTKAKFADPAKADLKTGCSEYDETDWEVEKPQSYWAKCWDKVA